MKKRLGTIIFILLCAGMCILLMQDEIVSPMAGKKLPAPVNLDLHALIKKARPGDKIILKEGLYKAFGLVIDKPLHITGQGNVIIDGNEQGNILTVNSNDVIINNLTFANVGTSFIEDRAAIKLVDARNCSIENNNIINGFFGIYLENSRDCIIRNNKIEGRAVRESTSGNALHLWHCRNITIRGNRTARHRDGIYFEFVEDSLIEKNISEDNIRYGLHFMFSHDNRYEDNKFYRNGAGVAVMYTRNVIMKNNHFADNWGPTACALLLKDIRDSKIIGNDMERNTIAIYSENCENIIIRDNNFQSNGYAVKIYGNSSLHTFSNNNFSANTFEVSTNAEMHQGNIFKGNYWSHYTGYDLDGDGVGDVPHTPVRLFSYMVEKQPPAIVLLRSFFVNILDASEKAMPIFSPTALVDYAPKIKKIHLKRKK